MQSHHMKWCWGAILEFKKMKFEENFMVCELDDMEAILSNTFLNTYQVGI
jgi:hypothetical protein